LRGMGSRSPARGATPVKDEAISPVTEATRKAEQKALEEPEREHGARGGAAGESTLQPPQADELLGGADAEAQNLGGVEVGETAAAAGEPAADAAEVAEVAAADYKVYP
jgi:hypothetical protein